MPDRFCVDKDDRELYEKAEEENILNFKERTRKEQFLLAMAIGFESKLKYPLNTKDGFFFAKDLRLEDEALINAIALHEHDSSDVLSNKNEVFKIAEEYTRGGIRLLLEMNEGTQFGSFDKRFEKELFETYDELCKGASNKQGPTR